MRFRWLSRLQQNRISGCALSMRNLKAATFFTITTLRPGPNLFTALSVNANSIAVLKASEG
jgi:hypothetical protein